MSLLELHKDWLGYSLNYRGHLLTTNLFFFGTFSHNSPWPILVFQFRPFETFRSWHHYNFFSCRACSFSSNRCDPIASETHIPPTRKIPFAYIKSLGSPTIATNQDERKTKPPKRFWIISLPKTANVSWMLEVGWSIISLRNASLNLQSKASSQNPDESCCEPILFIQFLRLFWKTGFTSLLIFAIISFKWQRCYCKFLPDSSIATYSQKMAPNIKLIFLLSVINIVMKLTINSLGDKQTYSWRPIRFLLSKTYHWSFYICYLQLE